MIGKILSEASHSIIGMFSAKPVDMETRTANNEFSSLLLAGENRMRPASGNAVAALKNGVFKNDAEDGVKDHSAKNDVELFLSQLIGSDDQPLSPASDRTPTKTIGLAFPVENGEDEATLSVPDVGTQLVSTLQPLAGGNANANASARDGANNGAQPKARPAFDLPQRNPAQLAATPDADSVQNQPAKTPIQTISALDAGKQVSVSPVNPASVGSVSNNRISNEVRKLSVATKPNPDAGTSDIVRGAAIANEARKAAQDSGAAQQILETKPRNSANAASKPLKAEANPFLAEMNDIPAAGDPERNIELSAPQPAASPASTQNAAQNMASRTVSFDWNAPQFAERFASELADLNISGDLKKFEISPRNMGRLEVSFISRGGVETIRIEAESDAVREVIVQHSQAIQDLLKANGRSDLNLRVDVKENMFAASGNGDLNPGQQNGGEAREGDSAPAHNRTIAQLDAIRADSDPVQSGSSDNSRYA